MKSALILIDIQHDYFPGGANPLEGAESAVANAGLILDRCRQSGRIIVHVQHVALHPKAGFFLPDTPGVQIHHVVNPLPNEKTIIKHYPNSFRETDLLDYLKSNSIDHLIIAGMMTHMCVDVTVRAAVDFGFRCTLIGDACATRPLEINGHSVSARDVHHSFLAALNYFYASVMPAEQFLNSSDF